MKRTLLAGVMLLAAASVARSEIVVYPDYPAAIERDGAYEVSVAQGAVSRPLVVWNHCEKSVLAQRTHGGDVNRRFCEFAFDGGAVRVDIAVRRDVRAYKVFPSNLRLRHAFSNGVVSVWLEKPAYFGIQVNDSDKSILSVFADAPETDVPRENAPGVMFVDGWVDATSPDGVIETDDRVKEIYLAPGAVLNARLRVKGRGTRLHGRGIVLDPMSDIFRFDQNRNTKRGVVSVVSDCTVEGVKLVDARTFNLLAYGRGIRLGNVKAMASMMCTDGLTAGGSDLLVENSWFYVGDNALVVSGLKNSVFRNVTIGTSCSAVFPQGTNLNVLMEDVNVFRADESLVANVYNGVLRRNNKWSEMNDTLQKREPDPQDLRHQAQDFTFRGFSAVDCTMHTKLFRGWNMGTLPKRFVFEDLAIPHAVGHADWRRIGRTDGRQIEVRNDPEKYLITGNYTIAVTNLCLGGRPANGFAAWSVKGATNELHLTVGTRETGRQMAMVPNRVETDWTCPASRREPAEPARTNLLEDRPATRSIWQRSPSWMVKLDATTRDERGAVVYRLTQCEKDAGMQAVVTERFRTAGNGRYLLSFDVRAKSETPFGLQLKLVSNEQTLKGSFPEIACGEWTHYEWDFDTDFDFKVFDLLSVGLFVTAPADEVCFRNLSLCRNKYNAKEKSVKSMRDENRRPK